MTALKLNNEGSVAFKREDYETAISKFTIGISSTNHKEQLSLLLSNRSSAYLKLKRFEEAVNDARACIKHRPDWSKGYLRLGKSLEGSGKNIEACEIYANAMKKNVEHRKLLLQPLVDANTICNHFDKDFMDTIALGDNFCNVCYQTADLFHCSHCQCLRYCSKEHQRQDWAKHKVKCKLLGEINHDLQEISSLEYSNNAQQLFSIEQAFPSLSIIKDWNIVWKCIECNISNDSICKQITEFLSWPLSLISSICKFDLEIKNKLCIHILGAEDFFIEKGLFTDLLEIFPLPDADMVLIGPELLRNVIPLKYTNAAGKCISLSFIADCYHNFTQQDKFVLPDLIFASHPNLHKLSYNWKPTLHYILANAIPCVFTSGNVDELSSVVDTLNHSLPNVNILHKGVAPFPSMLKRFRQERGNFDVYTMNSHWVCFKGGDSLTQEEIFNKASKAMAEACGIEDLDGVVGQKQDKVGEDVLSNVCELAYIKVNELNNEGVKRFEQGDLFSASNSFHAAIKCSEVDLNQSNNRETKEFEKKVKPVLAEVYRNLGLLAHKQGHLLKAVEIGKKSIAIDASYFDGHHFLGCMYERLHYLKPMEEAFRKCIEICPSDASAWHALGNALKQQGNLSEATFAYRQSEEIALINNSDPYM